MIKGSCHQRPTAVSRDLDPGSSQVIGHTLLGFFSYHSGVSPLLKCQYFPIKIDLEHTNNRVILSARK